MLAIQKITAGAIRAFIGAAIVFPVVCWVHAPGQGPRLHVTHWFLLVILAVPVGGTVVFGGRAVRTFRHRVVN